MDAVDLIKKCEEDYRFMSHWREIFFEYVVLKFHQPKKIIEVGAGSGAWAQTINDLLNYNDLQFLLIENYAGPGDEIGYDLPKNELELAEYIRKKTPNLNFSLSLDYDTDYLGYDVFRYDAWGYTIDKLDLIISNLTNNSIIIFDDFAFNKDPDLVLMVLTLAKDKKIFPIYASNKISCWSNNQEYSKKIITYLKDNKEFIVNNTNARFTHVSMWDIEGIDLDMILLQVRK